jgi:nitroreductase
VVSGAARDELADALVSAHRAGRRTLDFPYDESIYSPVHRRRRAAFGAAVYSALGIGRGDEDLRTDYDLKSLSFYGAPHVALLYAPESGNPRLTADVGMYAQTLLLAMAAHGVASCPQAVLSFYSGTIRETLGITGGKLLLGVSFGYADPDAPINAVEVGREPMPETTRFHR